MSGPTTEPLPAPSGPPRRGGQLSTPRTCRLCDGEGAVWWPLDEAVGGIEIARLCPLCWPPRVPSW